MSLAGGPYVNTALFCEKVIEDKEGVLSLIRIIDRIIQTGSGHGAPETMTEFMYQVTLVIQIKSGNARGPVQVKVNIEEPSGLVTDGPSMTALMEGEDKGQNLILNIQRKFSEAGLYWYNILLDEQLVTRVPLRIVYIRMSGPGQAGSR